MHPYRHVQHGVVLPVPGVVPLEQALSGRQPRAGKFRQVQIDESQFLQSETSVLADKISIFHKEPYLITPTTLDLLPDRDPDRARVQHSGRRVRRHLAGKLELLAPFDGVVFHLLPVCEENENESCIRLVYF